MLYHVNTKKGIFEQFSFPIQFPFMLDMMINYVQNQMSIKNVKNLDWKDVKRAGKIAVKIIGK